MNEKELLQSLVKECNSFSEILRKQGKAVSGASVKVLKQKLDSYKITYHFIKNNNTKPGKGKTLEEILTKDSIYQSSKLKIKLIEAGLKEDKCEVCGQNTNWNTLPLVLQLDHINGDHYDNRLENLRIICPNCHSQTDTFGTKRLKTINKCVDCGKEINLTSTRCPSCAAKYTAKIKKEKSNRIYPSKEELEKLILEKPFTEIGKMYGVQDNAVKKWCKNFGLPYRKQDIKELYFGQKYIPLTTVKCLFCGSEFKQKDKNSKFCCRDCYSSYIKQNGSLEKNHNHSNLSVVTKEKIEELYNSGKSFTGCASELKISRSALRRLCKTFDIKIW